MLDFFRRHQRYFFLVITIVVIISFSFFGTYSTLGSNTWREQIAFKAIDGREVIRSDVDEMALFLSTDAEDKMLFGGVWGPNFLNDGVIRNDFLETGLGLELALAYREDLQEDIEKRMAKEKKFKPYAHPHAPFLSVQNIWSYFSPQISLSFDSMQTSQNGLDSDALHHRIKLYLAEKQIPASTLRYLLRFQEKQYEWIKPDERLNQTDLSLFGYHFIEDWFGPNFTRLVSEFIINAAILAENQGYVVSKAEVLSDLVRKTQASYQSNQDNPNLGVTSAEEYLSEQLRRLNMDQARAIKIWRQVLLFRRYFHDAGANALVDLLTNQKLHHFAQESVTVDLYRLPPSLRLSKFDDLQNLEFYLYAVTKQDKLDILALPQEFLNISQVEKINPELIQKRYVLEVSQVSQKTLQARIGLRELWNWEVEEKNWNALAKQYPALGVKLAKTREERFEAMESLDPTTRTLVDSFSKHAIVKSHPEWVEQSLDAAKPEKMVVGLRIQGGKMPFSGLDEKEKRLEFIRLLDEAPLGENIASDSPLHDFSVDQQVYYRIAVLSRSKAKEILTFEEANGDGTLKIVGDRILEKYYAANRGKDASLYQNSDNTWKAFKDVRESVADQFFQKMIAALEPIQKSLTNSGDVLSVSKDRSASLRLSSYFSKAKEELKQDLSTENQWVKSDAQEEDSTHSLNKRSHLADQWKIEKATVVLNRQNSTENSPDMTEALALMTHEWSSVKTPINGDLAFYQVKERDLAPSQSPEIAQQVRELQAIVGDEAQRHLMLQVLTELKEKNAISLAYLKIPVEETPPEEIEMSDY